MPMIPRRRRRRISNSPGNRRSRNRRSQNAQDQGVEVVTLDDTCIDLTAEDDNFVDLTSRAVVTDSPDSAISHGANDESVVVIETPTESPSHGRRLRQIRNRLDTIEVANDDDDDDDLPPVQFAFQFSPRPSTSAVITSPEPIKLSCPICLDDDKTIKRSKRKLASTICGHVFCDECIKSAVRSQHVCPVCRKRLKLSDIHVLHI